VSCVVSRGLCDELITRPEESYRLWCVVGCDLETSRMGASYIYDISTLRFNTLQQKHSVKIILTTQSEDDIVTILQDIAKDTLSNGLTTRQEQLSWSDLSPSSQENFLEIAVSFEGSENALS